MGDRIEPIAVGVMRVTPRVTRDVEHVGFDHESAECPVLLRINAALAALRRAADADPDVLAALDELCPTAHTTGH